MALKYEGYIGVKKPKKFIEDYLRAMYSIRLKDVLSTIKSADIPDKKKKSFKKELSGIKFKVDNEDNPTEAEIKFYYFYNPKPETSENKKPGLYKAILKGRKETEDAWKIEILFYGAKNEEELEKLSTEDSSDDLMHFNQHENSLINFFKNAGKGFEEAEKVESK
ncbi:MAG: hypothetical protein R6U26_00970 [Candidatus Undinarchaeales archaeon]